ncbi:hypothetical protein BDY19DRAFT_906991 [Irpex rosettiformis]|uniref:Uncharacterized protein n=1 Tax=Irpex rosettiformis TaxID=378272 RepID=A0ACB8U167_9APHY|nr:hypothetical protein BDY19DRAFT_906991 [Irpex rosettiformis]
MAAAMRLPSTSETQLSSLGLQDAYSRRLTITELDLKDDRYPTISSSSRHTPGLSSSPLVYSNRPTAEASTTDGARTSWVEYSPAMGRQPSYNEAWGVEMPEKQTESSTQQPMDSSPLRRDVIPQTQNLSLAADGMGSAFTPSGSNPPFAGFDGRGGLPHDDNDADTLPQFLPARSTPRFPGEGLPSPDMGQRASGLYQVRDNQYVASSPRHPSLPAAGIGAAQSTSVLPPSPIIPMSAGPSYSPTAAAAAMAIPISPKPRAFAQQPTYINPSSANPAYAPPQVPKEEICVECAMRDQDMADVDVTSPGIWERESDVLYVELCQKEELEEMAGLPSPPENSGRPRAKGHRLTEENLKMWMSVNPKEPSSRQQTLDQYVKAQRALLEAEASAHSRAMRESRLIDDRMRDTYAQLRRSAYELGASAQPVDDVPGVRIKAPRSMSASLVPTGSHSREATLLQNGMIVEHVDVKKEEKERKREGKRERSRARKSSRSSRGGADVTSVYSLNTPVHNDSGFFSGMRSESRYSQSIPQRPTSIMTGGSDLPPTLLRAQSQASFSDMQSVGSSATSPRRSRFFGFKNLSTGFKSQDSLAPSGSMIDMHLALHHEQQYRHLANRAGDAVDIGSNAPTLRAAEGFPAPIQEQSDPTEVQATKKRKGLLKFWKLVTGQLDKREVPENRRSQSRSMDRTLDEPLAPPPPLSYLMNRGSKGHLSTPSLPSAISPSSLSPYATSPPTAPSSLIPSPTSSPRSTGDAADRKQREPLGHEYDEQFAIAEMPNSDYDFRGRTRQPSWGMPSTINPSSPPASALAFPTPRPRNAAVHRDKSLPPLPGESSVDFPYQQRPQTVFTYDPRTMPFEGLAPPDAAFRNAETRRQSFGGVTSRPFGISQTLPTKGAAARARNVPSFAEEKYAEFGMSGVPSGQMGRNSLYAPPDKPKKRKSKFGLTTLFGRKSTDQVDHPPVDPLDFSLGNSQDTRYMSMYVNENGYASPNPMSTSTHTPAPRMSMFSRKNIEELVDQDPEFIAYRYPSSDQRLDLVR